MRLPAPLRRVWPFVAAAAWALATPACAQPAAGATGVESIEYLGWRGALRLHNAAVEAVVVPEVGRVMSFRFREGENVLWQDASLAGQTGDADGRQWVNFGGDKTWPAPEAEWKNHTGNPKWMPPSGFDGLPATARVDGRAVILVSAVDAAYGVRASRRITLQGDTPVMQIETTYERASGAPIRVGIWVITQFIDPVAVYVPVPAGSKFRDGHFSFRDAPWPQLSVQDGLIRVTRDRQASHKLGSDAERMLWVGASAMCLVQAPRDTTAAYPDRGASAEVYTNPDPKAYVELETLGPLADLKPGERIRHTNTYTLFRRGAGADPEADARRVLAAPVRTGR